MIKQHQIARLTGISQPQISRIFAGETYGVTSAIKIGDILGKPWQEVFATKPLDLYNLLAKKVEEKEAKGAGHAKD